MKELAETLVECGHVTEVDLEGTGKVLVNGDGWMAIVDPFSDTLEGRRQLEALFNMKFKPLSPPDADEFIAMIQDVGVHEAMIDFVKGAFSD